MAEARSIAERYAATAGATWFPGKETLERPGYWFFPVGFVGSIGVVVEKSSGQLTPLGSAGERDDWLWGYERGFLGESVTLRVTAVADLERSLQVLQSCITAEFRWRYEQRSWLKEALNNLPADFPNQDLALAIPRFRDATEGRWFEYEVLTGAA